MTSSEAIAPAPSVAVSHRRVLAIALPMTVAHLTTPLLGVIDATVIGRLGDAALLGGVALGAVIFDFLFWGFGFLRMGTVGLAAQAVGRADRGEQRAVLARALALALACGLALIAFQAPIARLALYLAGATDEVNGAVATYFHVRIWAAPFTLANYALVGWLTGLGRTGQALALQAGMGVLNGIFTLVMVLSLGWGVAGSAAGTVLAEICGAAAGLLACAALLGWRLSVSWNQLANGRQLSATFALNRDILIRTAALMFAFSFFAAQGARTGDVTLAANAILNNLVMLAAYFLDGFATAAQQICGQAVGARSRAIFLSGLRLVLLWAAGFAAAASLLCFALGPLAIDVMSTNEAVRAAARAFLPYAAVLPLAGFGAYAFDGVYVGALWSRDMRNLMVSALVLYLAAWWLLQPLGNAGLWLSLLIFLTARGLLQAARLPALLKRTFLTT